MFNLGFWEMVVLAGIALIVVGPEKLPSLARNVGRFINDLKRTTNTIASDITDAVDEENFLNKNKQDGELIKTSGSESDLEEDLCEDESNHLEDHHRDDH